MNTLQIELLKSFLKQYKKGNVSLESIIQHIDCMQVSPNIDELNNRIKLLGKQVNTLIKLYNELKRENKDLEIKVRLVMNKNKITNGKQLQEHLK